MQGSQAVEVVKTGGLEELVTQMMRLRPVLARVPEC